MELKAIKRLVPAECTYETILYYVKKTHWKYRTERIKRLKARMNELIELQVSIEQIKAEIGSPDYYIEQAILEHIEKNPNKEWRYIQHESGLWQCRARIVMRKSQTEKRPVFIIRKVDNHLHMIYTRSRTSSGRF